MALREFEHVRAASLEEASCLAASAGREAALVAGGTDLLGILKDSVHHGYPNLLIDLKAIEALDFIEADGNGARIGALATLADIAKSPALRERYRLVALSAASAASPQIRNMGTLGGNLCQEPRCWYYRSPDGRFPCLRKGGGACNAISGENRFHSIFGAARLGMPGCRAGCPGNVDIPLYLGRVREGDTEEAARILLRNNPMPAVTGRVCPHFCERDCNRVDGAVSIRAVERTLGDFILENSARLMPGPDLTSGKRVAVVGSGPAGLSAAFYLRRAGHEVRVFDEMPVAGGMLAYGIPAYRLPKTVVAKLVAAYQAMGIRFELGAKVGTDLRSLENLRRDCDAVFLATGAWLQKGIAIPGAEKLAAGLLGSGLEFLIDIQKGALPAAPEPSKASRAPGAIKPGDKVLVIGGGNVAVDVAISALRLGAAEVTMACLEARDIMPAFPEDLEEAVREGVRLLPSWGPKSAAEADGRVSMELVGCTSVFDAEGRFRPSFDPSQTMRFEADRILLAVGQGADLSYAPAALKLERGLIVADKDGQATSIGAVYAGGDATTGPASVVEALAAGRRAAAAIDVWLSRAAAAIDVWFSRAAAAIDARLGEAAQRAGGGGALHEIRAEALRKSPRAFVPALGTGAHAIGAEDKAGIGLAEVEREARRCLDCGCVAVNASDLAPALLTLDAVIVTNRRSIAASDFFAARVMSTTHLESGEIVTEIRLPAPKPGSIASFHKFRIRNAIDFPILSVAAAFVVTDGLIAGAAIAIGAAAPVPLRARAVEDFLVGRPRNEETAEAAAAIAVRGAFPLERNGYKVQILRALVTKAILTAS